MVPFYLSDLGLSNGTTFVTIAAEPAELSNLILVTVTTGH